MIASPFSRLSPAPSDPVFAIAAEAKAAGKTAIDATVGMIPDVDGQPLVLPSVREAAQALASALPQENFGYPPLLGLLAYRSAVTRLIFGNQKEHIASIATTGGTGALMLHLKFLKLLGITEVLLPVPSWPNHRRLLDACGCLVREVPYLERDMVSLRALMTALSSAAQPQGILLQVCGHNPTGFDPSEAQWRELAKFLRGRGHVVLLDLAYQGLTRGVGEDAAPVRLLREAGIPLLVAWSASKNHTIYGLRTGLACAVADDEAQRREVERHFMILIREVHSAASVTGQQIVALVQERFADRWHADLADLRAGLSRRRVLLRQAFSAWTALLDGAGLYALLPLSAVQILSLKQQGVFLLPDGRVNIAGIPEARMEEFIAQCRRIIAA